MRHRRHRSKLNRTTEHRAALMRNLAIALIEHGCIHTTAPKAKQTRQFVERVITIAREGLAASEVAVSTAKRRLAFGYLNDKEAVKRLFAVVAPACANRPGGYTRVVRTSPRAGDGAPMAYLELVDREIVEPTEKKSKKAEAVAEK